VADSPWVFVAALQAPAAPPAPPAPPAAPTTSGPEAPVVIDVQPPSDIAAPGRIIINGKEMPIGAPLPSSEGTSIGVPDLPPNIYSLAQGSIIGLTMVLVAFPVFGFLKALVNRRAMAQPAALPRETTERLARIEASVDAMAEQIERISEGQRFVTKVLAERSAVER
jgi:hypothetical protein